VFLPLKKYVDPAMNANKKKSSAKKHQSRKVIDYQSYLAKQGYNVVSGKAPKAEPGKKKAAKKTVLKQAKSKSKTAAKKKAKTTQKKTVAKQSSKKKTVVKKAPVVKKKQAKPAKKKAVEKPAKKKSPEKAVQAQELKKETVTESVAKKEEVAEKKGEAVPVVEKKAAPDVDLDDVTFVGYRELDKLQLQSKIQQAVELAWRPPAGMPQKTVCELLVTVGAKGKVVQAKVSKTSKIVAFDLSARSAIYKTVFPQEVWGKQITVELGI